MPPIYGTEAHSPKEIAAAVEDVGVAKANLRLLPMVALGVLAGAFIALGALYYTVVASDPKLSFATARVLGGLVFSTGLILVIVAGAELFTGNNLMVMAWVSRRITLSRLLRNFAVVYLANLAGALFVAFLVYFSGHWKSGLIGVKAVEIAAAKTHLPYTEAFFRGILCNMLVCLAVWIAMGARTVTGKILAVIFPISAFVAAGFEHCVANMYLIPLGILLAGSPGSEITTGPIPIAVAEAPTWSGFAANLLPVTAGNLFGGAVLVAAVYWAIYRRQV